MNRVEINDSGGSLNINFFKLQIRISYARLFYFGRSRKVWIILKLINDFCLHQNQNSKTSFDILVWIIASHHERIRKGQKVPQIILWLFKAVHSINHENYIWQE